MGRQTETFQSEAAYLMSVLLWLQDGGRSGPGPAFYSIESSLKHYEPAKGYESLQSQSAR
jgi:hypothetical protein